jgi:ribokinase
MNRVLNFGSINVDHVYKVENFVRAGETIRCDDYRRFAGGKGLNQSIALAQAGADVYHAGKLCAADTWLLSLMQQKGVDTRYAELIDGPSGHALIQVNADGENAIVIVGGANQHIGGGDITRILADFGLGDYLLVQNEINAVPEILRAAKERGLTIAFNPAPMTAEVAGYPLELVDELIVNESEASTLTSECEPQEIFDAVRQRCPGITLILTLGSKGAAYFSPPLCFVQPATPVEAVDSTGAGDTAVGFYLAELIRTRDPRRALALGSAAAALAVTRRGAADSIPSRREVEAMMA